MNLRLYFLATVVTVYMWKLNELLKIGVQPEDLKAFATRPNDVTFASCRDIHVDAVDVIAKHVDLRNSIMFRSEICAAIVDNGGIEIFFDSDRLQKEVYEPLQKEEDDLAAA